MSSGEPIKDDAPVTAKIRAPLSTRVMKRCHDQAMLVDDATETLWRRELAQPRPIQRGSDKCRDWKTAALRLAAAMRKRESDAWS